MPSRLLKDFAFATGHIEVNHLGFNFGGLSLSTRQAIRVAREEIENERRDALLDPGGGIAPEHSSAGGCDGVDRVCFEASLGPQWLNHDNLLGMGTVVTPGGEPFLFGLPDSLIGFGGGVRVAVGNPDFAGATVPRTPIFQLFGRCRWVHRRSVLTSPVSA